MGTGQIIALIVVGYLILKNFASNDLAGNLTTGTDTGTGTPAPTPVPTGPTDTSGAAVCPPPGIDVNAIASHLDVFARTNDTQYTGAYNVWQWNYVWHNFAGGSGTDVTLADNSVVMNPTQYVMARCQAQAGYAGYNPNALRNAAVGARGSSASTGQQTRTGGGSAGGSGSAGGMRGLKALSDCVDLQQVSTGKWQM